MFSKFNAKKSANFSLTFLLPNPNEYPKASILIEKAKIKVFNIKHTMLFYINLLISQKKLCLSPHRQGSFLLRHTKLHIVPESPLVAFHKKQS